MKKPNTPSESNTIGPNIPGNESDRDTSQISPPARSLAPAVRRAITILSLLEASPHRRLSVSDLARSLQAPKSSVLNICTELQASHLIRRTHDGYQLGRRLVQLGSAYVNSVHLVQEFYEACKSVSPDIQAL